MDSIRQHFRPNRIYHLTHTTVEKAPLLVENIDMWQIAWETAHGCRTLAWTVLPDHMHLLVDPGQIEMKELSAHADYIHYNAVRHGLVAHPSEWEHSSFHSYVETGAYPADWGTVEPRAFDGDFGD